MADFTMSRQIAASPEVVFDVATDLAKAAQHVRGIERIELLTPGPIGVGTKWRETRKMMGMEATETLEVKEFDRPNKYVVGCDSCGCHFETTFTFTPQAGGTNLTLDVRSEAETLFAKIMSPIGDLAMGKTMRKYLDEDLDDVQRISESRASAATTS